MKRPHRVAALAVLLTLASCGEAPTPVDGRAAQPEPKSPPPSIAPSARVLEGMFDARLGIYAIDTGSGTEIAYRADTRFPYASTFKALAAGAILRKYGLRGMDREVRIKRLANAFSPVTRERVGTTMTLTELCDAAVRYSDNTAANLLLDRLGGPKGLDAMLEDLGDGVTRMERREPELNDWAPGQTRDTSTPRALARDLRAFVLGDVLGRPEREQLVDWLRRNTTGAGLIRAGVPDGWRVGDKTGTGGTYGSRNDIAVVWPPGRAPIVIAIMSNRRLPDAEPDDKLIERAADIVIAALR